MLDGREPPVRTAASLACGCESRHAWHVLLVITVWLGLCCTAVTRQLGSPACVVRPEQVGLVPNHGVLAINLHHTHGGCKW